MSDYDAIVLGAGTAGEVVAWTLHEAGMSVAVIERELIGGLCAYWGCMPSKTLLRPGDIAWQGEHGVGTNRQGLDWSEIAPYRNYMVRDWNDSKQVKGFQEAGITFRRGDARITGPGQVQVDGETLTGRRLIISTGSENSIPPIEGLREAGYWTNREATSFQEIPKSVLVIGGGAIGSELGQALRHYGAKVTIVEEADHLLGRESADAARYLQGQFETDGIVLHLGRRVTKVERTDSGRTATLDDGTRLSAEHVLAVTGRHALIDNLGLDAIGIHPDKGGIECDEHCRASQDVWAAGDVTGVAMYTHVASYQARIVADDILGRPRVADYTGIPRVTFTQPEVASVGITDPKQGPDGMEVVTAQTELGDMARTETYGKGYSGALCLLADRHHKVLVGAWAVGPLAGEWIQWATLAIRARVPVHVLEDTILAFPTFTEMYTAPLRSLMKSL